MNQTIKLTKGLEVPMEGAAAKEVKTVSAPAVYTIVPDHFAGIKPKMLVKEGAVVKAGSPLFCSKQNEEMLFASPVSGKVTGVVRGDRRKVMAITIEADEKQEFEQFDTKVSNGAEVKALLLKAGVWSCLRQRPYDCIAMPEKQPKAIFISSFDSAPLAPDYAFVCKGQQAALQAAISALKLIAPVYMGVKAGAEGEFANLKDCTITPFQGVHPAGNVGVQINHVLPIAKGETVYTVNIQDLLILGRFFQSGKVDMHRLVALTGPLAKTQAYYNVLPGMPVEAILKCNVEVGVAVRLVAGNALSGHKMEADEVIEPACNQITVLAEGIEARDFFGWIMPRFTNFSMNRAVVGHWLAKLGLVKHFDVDARLLGGRRAIIQSNEYDRVFPMDIYPEYLIKAMIAGNLDRMEQLGAYEVAPEDFALCEYVCTSKMPLQAIVRQALDNMKQELE